MAAKTKRRRASGEGTVRKRKDGRWEGRLVIGYRGGKDVTKSVYGATQRAVVEKLATLKAERAQGLPLRTERQTLAVFLERWLHDVAAQRLRAQSLAYYRARAAQLVTHIGHVPLGQLTPQQVQGALGALLQSGVAPRTVANARLVLRTALDDALTWGLVGRNAAALTHPPRVESYRPQLLTVLEVQRLLAVARETRLAWTVAIALGSLGLRRGEVLGLRWRDVELDTGTITIAQTNSWLNGRVITGPPKSAASRRTLPLPPSLVTLLRERHVEYLGDRLFAGSDWVEGELVVCTWRGTPAGEFSRHFHDLLERAGLPRMRFHDLRHSCASLLAAQGESTKSIMDWLGHATPAMALHYTHIAEQMRRRTATAFDALFDAPSLENKVG